jgi:hypothetical protein
MKTKPNSLCRKGRYSNIAMAAFAVFAVKGKAATLIVDLGAMHTAAAYESGTSGFVPQLPQSSRLSAGGVSGSFQPTAASPAPAAAPVVAAPPPQPASPGKPEPMGQAPKPAAGGGGGGAPASPVAGPVAPTPAQPQTPVAPPASDWKVRWDVGWQSDYYFRGLDILDRVSPDGSNSGMARTVVDATYQRGDNLFNLGFAYLYALDQTLPNGNSEGFDGPQSPAWENLQNFSTAPKDRYTELNLRANYARRFGSDTIKILPEGHAVVATLGLAHYRFSNGEYWRDNRGSGVDSTTEAAAELAYLGIGGKIPLAGGLNWGIVPLIRWTHDFDAFEGDYLEAEVSANFQYEPWKLTVTPRIGLAYDMEYNGDNSGWNNLEAGVTVSRPLTPNTTLSLVANYTQDLGDGNSDGSSRTDSGFFTGLTLSTLFGPSPTPLAPVMDGKNMVLRATPDRGRWSIRGGAGYRTIDADFHSKPMTPFDALSLVDRRNGGGARGFAGSGGAVYLNGGIGSSFGDGTSPYSGGSSVGANQVMFNSRHFNYRQEQSNRSIETSDSDEMFFPYVEASYEFVRKGPFSFGAGLGYSFASAEMGTGYQPSTFSQGYERISNQSFIYDIDNELAGGIITDPVQYGNQISSDPAFFTPQSTEEVIENEMVRVAGFLDSTLNVDMHELSIPFSFTYKPHERVDLTLSFGPTLTIFESELTSKYVVQDLPNLAGGKKLAERLGFSSRKLQLNNDGGFDPDGNPLPGSSQFVASSASASASAASPAAPSKPQQRGRVVGKGSLNTKTPGLPGRTLARVEAREDSTDFAFGFMGQGTATIYLDDQQRWMLEMWGRYNYVDSVTVSNGMTSAEIDPSAWSVGIGLGCRF